MNQAVIGFGSNIEPELNIHRAKTQIVSQFQLLAESGISRTTPIGIKDQPEFWNGAWLIQTSLSQNKLRSLLKKVEDDLRRDRSAPKFGPRTIDLDILVWNNVIIDPDVDTRDFLRKEISELLPDMKF
ncbi:MAG TPA: 2-amino-4-hydroxy-6-hydroxymethyldihydropteridine diphosphokinase [Candidatus Omnitrophota bacterium]|jgi:2-amino-4-hydroxy-6-hydroxymethyldihydropteridine diphosphokinase|nr:2-amino-4-hydroxy-6-hydroxymethyldihydropteridine diphosphokinase [Candidatus Omnitrophota bacterium]HSA31459.1 2-amino-4-hydroxy-6-hydroxymethyldihydropteridine diphosphokinase [Candidatus Omnitrophota bacterium]